MASHVRERLRHTYARDETDSYSEEEDDDEEAEEEEEVLNQEEEQDINPDGCKSFIGGRGRRHSEGWLWGNVLDPRARWVQEWNRIFLLVSAAGLFVDPLFFYALSVSENCMCLFVDGWFAVTVTVLRTTTDALNLWNMCLQLKMNRRSTGVAPESRLHDVDPTITRSIASKYLKSKKGIFLDLFVILPLPQIVMWVAIPKMLDKGSTTMVMTVLLVTFIFQYVPKIYHSVCLLRRMQNLSGYTFGTVWWGIALNMIAYFVASHAVGACWYLLGLQRAAKCLKEQCMVTKDCNLRMMACQQPIYYGTTNLIIDRTRFIWGENNNARSTCLGNYDNFAYGAYKWTVQLVSNENRLEKIMFPIFWGLMTLSTFGNLESTTDWLEVVFIIIVLTTGLILVTMLIGNIKVFLHATTSKKQAMQLKMRNIEWWMRKRRLPLSFRQRMRNYERQRWAAMRGVDECEMTRNLPEGLRRDIKYHLCLDLVRQVPLFQHMDNLVLENICDRVKSLIFTKGEIEAKEKRPIVRTSEMVRRLFSCFGKSATASRHDDNVTADITTEEQRRGGPVVVELFTSQGCATSPEAELLFSRLGRGDFNLDVPLILLAYHVDYWDYMGWKDPFGSSQWTVRQKAYVETLNLDTMFTPQVVIQGRVQCVGNDSEALISAIANEPRVSAPTFQAAFQKPASDLLQVSLTGSLRTKADHQGVNVMVSLYECSLVTDCPSGPNKDRVLANDYVVRRLEKLCSVKDVSAKKIISGTVNFPLWEGFSAAKCGVAVFVESASHQIFGSQKFQLPENV